MRVVEVETLELIAFTKAALKRSNRSLRPMTEAVPLAVNGCSTCTAFTTGGSLHPAKLVAKKFTSERLASLRTAAGRSDQRQAATNAARGEVRSDALSVTSTLTRPSKGATR